MHGLKFVIICLWLLFVGDQARFFGAFNATSANGSFASALEAPNSNALPETGDWTLYDPDPKNIWNRLYRSLYQREGRDGHEYGFDELDPLLWYNTKYLLNDPAEHRAIEALDEFISTNGERQIKDPLKRAILQRDLWAIFDWTTQTEQSSPDKVKLQTRLVQVMKRLALSPGEIGKLPDSYEDAQRSREFTVGYAAGAARKAVLPSKLFDPKGPWVRLAGLGGDLITRGHTSFASGRSTFSIFIRLPDGRQATLDYLTKLSSFPNPWLPDPRDKRVKQPNQDLPQFPAGTQLALVRKMMLIDNQGNIQPTDIIEDMQIRVHRIVPARVNEVFRQGASQTSSTLDVFEFKLSRSKLFADKSGGLRAVAEHETEFPLFQSFGVDLFEGAADAALDAPRVSLNACASCHAQPGVHSIRSRLEADDLIPAYSTVSDAWLTRVWKKNQYSWGLLQGFWQLQP